MVNIWLMMVNNLVGGFSPTPLKKYDFVSWDDDIPNRWKNKKSCSKPPTRPHFLAWIVQESARPMVQCRSVIISLS